MKIPRSLVPFKKKRWCCFSSVCYIGVSFAQFSVTSLSSGTHYTGNIFPIRGTAFSWLVALQEGATWPRTSLPSTEARGHFPSHTPLSSFSMSSLTSWTNAIQRKETQEASFPRSCSSWKYCFCARWTVRWDFHSELKPWRYLPASHTTAEGQLMFCTPSSECGHLCV